MKESFHNIMRRNYVERRIIKKSRRRKRYEERKIGRNFLYRLLVRLRDRKVMGWNFKQRMEI